MFPLWVAWHFHDSFFFAVHPFLISPPPTLPRLSPRSALRPPTSGPNLYPSTYLHISCRLLFSHAGEPSILIPVSFGGPYGGWTTGRGNEMDNRTAVRSRGRICLASNACSLKKRKLRKEGPISCFRVVPIKRSWGMFVIRYRSRREINWSTNTEINFLLESIPN